MLKVKIPLLPEIALSWAMAKHLKLEPETLDPLTWKYTAWPSGCYNFASDLALSGVYIFTEKIDITHYSTSRKNADMHCRATFGDVKAYGETLSVAVIRCLLMKHYGDEFEVPKELLCQCMTGEWSGSPNPDNPDHEWLCDECNRTIPAS